ncbi:CehA/McbA family metallohydrolase [Clostridium sp. HBUAS56010]|uniref:CehA/McbA family metallohydrolase n=1 Tax=Clostridium sp. HBUAS56010 TaxID=2571127 RepID=UPI001177EF3E|nr:CehA/McbA family metallohydrolase [Clostridium sp. HBUAS56010]
MIYKRAELHNHSTESDGTMTIGQLVKYAEEQKFEVLALTDHNTCSGHDKADEEVRKNKYDVSILKGVEITTFYGHILALGMKHMTDITELNPKYPEAFFMKLRAEGAAAVGIAHPFCIGEPLMIGCRFGMDVKNWNSVDYIEIFNTSSGTKTMGDGISGNKQALELWEELVLQGYKIGAVTGKDIHGKPKDERVFITYAMFEKEPDSLADGVIGAILRQRTMITKGPLFHTVFEGRNLIVHFDHTSSYFGWDRHYKEYKVVLQVKWNDKTVNEWEVDLNRDFKIPVKNGASTAIIELYDSVCDMEHLLAVGAPVRWRGER